MEARAKNEVMKFFFCHVHSRYLFQFSRSVSEKVNTQFWCFIFAVCIYICKDLFVVCYVSLYNTHVLKQKLQLVM